MSEHPTEPDQERPTENRPLENGELVTPPDAAMHLRAQLQATAQVHQQALIQVGSLREKTSTLEHELERSQAAEAEAKSELEALREEKARLEGELERSKSSAFAWVRKLFS